MKLGQRFVLYLCETSFLNSFDGIQNYKDIKKDFGSIQNDNNGKSRKKGIMMNYTSYKADPIILKSSKCRRDTWEEGKSFKDPVGKPLRRGGG